MYYELCISLHVRCYNETLDRVEGFGHLICVAARDGNYETLLHWHQVIQWQPDEHYKAARRHKLLGLSTTRPRKSQRSTVLCQSRRYRSRPVKSSKEPMRWSGSFSLTIPFNHSMMPRPINESECQTELLRHVCLFDCRHPAVALKGNENPVWDLWAYDRSVATGKLASEPEVASQRSQGRSSINDISYCRYQNFCQRR